MSRTSVPTARKFSRDKASRASLSKGDPVNTQLLDQSLGYSLRRAQLSTYPDFLETMEHLGVRPSEFAVLTLVLTNPASSQSAIGDALNIHNANVLPLRDQLETSGMC